MTNGLFVVCLESDDEYQLRRILGQYDKVFQLRGGVYLISTEESAGSIARSLEMGEEGITGEIFKLNGSYAGYSRQELWEWLKWAEAPV